MTCFLRFPMGQPRERIHQNLRIGYCSGWRPGCAPLTRDRSSTWLGKSCAQCNERLGITIMAFWRPLWCRSKRWLDMISPKWMNWMNMTTPCGFLWEFRTISFKIWRFQFWIPAISRNLIPFHGERHEFHVDSFVLGEILKNPGFSRDTWRIIPLLNGLYYQSILYFWRVPLGMILQAPVSRSQAFWRHAE